MTILESIDRDFKIDHKQTPKDILTGENIILQMLTVRSQKLNSAISKLPPFGLLDHI